MMLKIRKSKIKLISVISCISLLSLSYVGLSFYSIPEKVSAAEEVEEWRTLNDITYMQDMTVDICNNSEIGDHKALIDNRGGGYDNDGVAESYVVQKLGDGNCWMVQNMKLDLDTAYALTPDNSDVRDPWPTNVALDTLKSTVDWANDDRNPYYRKGSAMLNSSYQDKYGHYYNWCAATAGTCVDSGEALSSVCPKGWKMPTSNKGVNIDGSFNKLSYIQTGDLITSNDYGLVNAFGRYIGYGFFPAAGRFNSASLDFYSAAGYYWSSTTTSSVVGSAYVLLTNKEGVYPSRSISRSGGFSIRCVNNLNIHSEPLSIERDTNLAVRVAPTITIDAISGMQEEATSAKITTGNITATVATNATSYQVLLSAEQTDLVSKNADNTHIIPASTEIVVNKNGWGILNEDATYAAITNKPTPYYNTRTTGEDIIGVKHVFGVGISVSSTLPADTYSTNVTITAAAV